MKEKKTNHKHPTPLTKGWRALTDEEWWASETYKNLLKRTKNRAKTT